MRKIDAIIFGSLVIFAKAFPAKIVREGIFWLVSSYPDINPRESENHKNKAHENALALKQPVPRG